MRPVETWGQQGGYLAPPSVPPEDEGKRPDLAVSCVTKRLYENSEFASVAFDGGDGLDLVWFYDSVGDETLEAWTDHATVTNGAGDGVWNFTVEVAGIEDLRAYARNGGTDSAVFHGSDGADKFKSYENSVRLRAVNSAYQLRAKFFDTVVCDGGSGGSDTAVFSNGEGADTFTYDGADALARLQGTDRDHSASGFSAVVVRSARDDGDTAQLYESSATDLDLLYEASGFDRVKAYSSSGGDDTTDIGENSLDLYLYGWDE